MKQCDHVNYSAWKNMRRRCLDKKNKDYKYYGGRGITICQRWLKFGNFVNDMGKRPVGMTLERIDNNGDYEPGNCMWVTRREQQSNKRNRNIRYLTHNGETLCISDWAKRLGVDQSAIHKRFSRGWNLERVLSTAAIRSKGVV